MPIQGVELDFMLNFDKQTKNIRLVILKSFIQLKSIYPPNS